MPNLLYQYGWNEKFAQTHQASLASGLFPARVLQVHKGRYLLQSESKSMPAEISGRMSYTSTSQTELPCVGDWVLAHAADDLAIIESVIERSSLLKRGLGKHGEEQAIAANLDTVFVVTSLNQEYNPARIDRFLNLIFDAGSKPVIIASKADLIDAQQDYRQKIEARFPHIPVHLISVQNNLGLQALTQYMPIGSTVALVGSSGVGKSTLVNWACHTEQKVQDIRDEDGKGRHTTTSRELLLTRFGGALIDTPGMREVGLSKGSEGNEETFAQIINLAQLCKFTNCSHETEPGCEIIKAIERGEIASKQLKSYQKQQREISRVDPAYRRQQREKWKKITKQYRKDKKSVF